MEISILLAEQILAMFLTMAVGFGVVRAGLFKTEDSRIISNMVVYICNPCVVVHSFQIELTDDKIKGLMIAIGLSVVVHMVLIIGSEILSFIFHFNSIEKASIIYTNAGYLVIPLVGAVLGRRMGFLYDCIYPGTDGTDVDAWCETDRTGKGAEYQENPV